MVAKIESGKSLIGALNYNERKVEGGKAELILAQLYAKDPPLLSFDEKLFRLADLAARNTRVKTHAVHLSLNFDPSERLNEERLKQIAESYMEKIGFGRQPYLVYQHFDAGHNHVHLLTTNIDADGNRISLHNIGKLKSEPARKAIELEFGLVEAADQIKASTPQQVKPLIYGATDTKRAITNIVNYVAQTYKFTSLPEFNAVLAGYHVLADRGSRETVMFNRGGLRYWALDKDGKKIGVPIKASSIYKKPTLKLLNERFKLNDVLRKAYKTAVVFKLDEGLASARTFGELKNSLASANIQLLIRENSDGRIYGLTFIDHENKAVFNGSDLGKPYSASAVELRLKINGYNTQSANGTQHDSSRRTHDEFQTSCPVTLNVDLLAGLLSPVNPDNSLSLFEKKKKKKRKRLKL